MEDQISIQDVSERLGLPKSTLRYWERAFNGLISPTRTPGGQRRYSDSDVEIISSIHRYKKMRFSLSQIKDHLLRASQHLDHFETHQIDQLASKIAHTVRREIYHFFEREPQQGQKMALSKTVRHDLDR
jgi:DNA-binding transcriptional MerR regulator